MAFASLLIAALGSISFGGCADYEEKSQFCSKGIVCPAGKVCTRDGDGCIDSNAHCGDGHRDADEACDDGNVKNLDGCNAKCEKELCGDGVLQATLGERCDRGTPSADGLATPADAPDCDSDCTPVECGDGHPNAAAGEKCDQGASNGETDLVYGNYLGCTKQCQVASYCGDETLDKNFEECDPGATQSATCNLSVQATESSGVSTLPTDCKMTRCGDGYANIKAGETCDVPNKAETADCNFSPDAVVGTPRPTDCRTSRCGDGYRNSSDEEECDLGDLGNDPTPQHNTFEQSGGCTDKCRLRARCGDGKLDEPWEECDQGDAKNLPDEQAYGDKDACTTSCERAPFCGDGIKYPPKEDCDGEKDCDANCKSENCGNGKVDPGEECDDRIVTDFTSELNNGACIITGRARENCKLNRCGDGHVFAGVEACDDEGKDTERCDSDCTLNECGDRHVNLTTESCDAGVHGSVECNGVTEVANMSCRARDCGDGVVNPSLKPDGTRVEECDWGVDGTAKCDLDCTLRRCGDGTVNPNQYTEIRGQDSIFWPAEECDNGPGENENETAETKSCNRDCTISVCGDGKVNRNEQCDPEDKSANAVPCTRECLVSSCGDGYKDTNATPPEQCDEGPADTKTCTKTCKSSYCGDGYLNAAAGEMCDDGGTIDGDGCTDSCRHIELGYGCPNAGTPCVRLCGNSQIDELRAAAPCPGQWATNNKCEDYIETCDDGNLTPGDGCNDSCRIETAPTGQRWICPAGSPCQLCGNSGVASPETCDDGNLTPGDGCNESCSIETAPTGQRWICSAGSPCQLCGNSGVASPETCDDGNLTPGDGCNGSCQCEEDPQGQRWICPAPPQGGPCQLCGNSAVTSPETCDDGNLTIGDGCDATCTVEPNVAGKPWLCPTPVGGPCVLSD